MTGGRGNWYLKNANANGSQNNACGKALPKPSDKSPKNKTKQLGQVKIGRGPEGSLWLVLPVRAKEMLEKAIELLNV